LNQAVLDPNSYRNAVQEAQTLVKMAAILRYGAWYGKVCLVGYSQQEFLMLHMHKL